MISGLRLRADLLELQQNFIFAQMLQGENVAQMQTAVFWRAAMG